MTKGWYGNKYGHSLASKGIRTQNIQAYGVKSYGEWIKGVDNEFWKYIGLGVHDMPDYMWRALYDDTLTPREAFRTFIEDNLEEFGDAGWEIMSKMDEEDGRPPIEKDIDIQHFKQFKVGVIDENGKEYIEYFDDEKEAYERWLDYRSGGDETWYSRLISEDIGEYETVEMYDPDRDEDGDYWASVIKVMKLLKKESIDPNYVSPNFVNDFANNRGISLSSDEVVRISNNYDKHYEAHGEEKKSPTAKNINKTISNVEKSASRTAEDINITKKKVGGAIDRSASRTAEEINEARRNVGKRIDEGKSKTSAYFKKLSKRFDDSATDTAKFLKRQSKRIDDSASETSKHIKKTFEVKKDE